MEAYLTWVFVRRGTQCDKYADLGVAELTPQAYKLAMLAASQPP